MASYIIFDVDATDNLIERAEKSAMRFVSRHNISLPLGDNDPIAAINMHVYATQDWYLRRLWQRCFARAVGVKGAQFFANGRVAKRSSAR